jgi:aminoglycoside/choline kinase family phosphotransferase
VQDEQLGWVANVLACDRDAMAAELVAGDASPRRFYRIRLADLSTQMLMVSPPTENNERFILVQRLLENNAIRVPRLPRADLAAGCFLLEDLGDTTFAIALREQESDGLYRKALDILSSLQAITANDVGLPCYDAKELQRELDVCPEWFFSRVLELVPDSEATNVFTALSDCLIEVAHHQPQGFVHRDYHSRNLMVTSGDPSLAVIDFQDAIIGPIAYDVASLLKDVYVVWPREQQLIWLKYYWELLLGEGRLSDDSWHHFVVCYDLVGLQRHVKILGVFSRLWLRDDKPDYMSDIPAVINYIQEVCVLYREAYPAIGAFWEWFEQNVMPTVVRQDWYKMT